MGRLLSSCEAN